MRNYPKTYTTRYALWRAHDMKCFYCGEPVDFINLNIDHILPQSLLGNPTHLEVILCNYEIEENYPGFSIDGLLNLVPCHGVSCNFRKSDSLFPKTATLFYLTLAHDKLPKVVNELERLRTTSRRGEVLGKLGTLLESGEISEQEVINILRDWEYRCTSNKPLVITLGLNFANTVNMRGMTVTETSRYATICNQLESELVNFLRAITNNSFHYTEASGRDGETLSVRLVFPELEINDVDSLQLDLIEKSMPWWEVLEVSNFYDIYGESYEDAVEN